MAQITLEKVTKVYPNGFEAVHELNLDVADGEFMVLVGPSGCGKTTALRMVAGLEEISNGNDMILLGKKEVNSRAYCAAFNFKGADQQKKVGTLSGGERNRVHLAKMLKKGANLLLLDEPTNDLDVETLRALEDALTDYAGCAVIISHDRFFLDRIATHMLAFEGDSHVEWFEGNFADYEEDKKRRLGKDELIPHRMKYKKFSR